jgi:hypothetical protein
MKEGMGNERKYEVNNFLLNFSGPFPLVVHFRASSTLILIEINISVVDFLTTCCIYVFSIRHSNALLNVHLLVFMAVVSHDH